MSSPKDVPKWYIHGTKFHFSTKKQSTHWPKVGHKTAVLVHRQQSCSAKSASVAPQILPLTEVISGRSAMRVLCSLAPLRYMS